MISFMTFIKIVKRQFWTMFIYLGIFLVVMTMNISSKKSGKDNEYINTSVKVAIVDKDNSTLSNGLKKYINKNMEAKDIIETEEGMEEALFQRVADYIIIIPKGYEEKMIAGESPELMSKQVADAYSAVFAKNIIEQYISTFETFLNLEKEESYDIEELVKKTDGIMSLNTEVGFAKSGVEKSDNLNSAFNFGAYCILASVIWATSEILSTYFKKNIEDRVSVSPLIPWKNNIRLILYCSLFGIGIWLVNIAMYIGLLGNSVLNMEGFLLGINLFVMTIVAIALGFMVCTLVKSKEGRSAAANTIALGCCFISGVFMPAEMISKGVLKVAAFTPTYWFVKTNDLISQTSVYSYSIIRTMVSNMGIELLFAIMLVSIGLVAKRQHKAK